MEKSRFDRLEKQGDKEGSAVLRWAIFTLEQLQRR